MTQSPITLYPYQKRWIADRSRFKIGVMARQIGKTFTTTLEIVQRCLYAEAHGTNERWVILSRGERQAREAMEEGVKKHLQAYQSVFNSLEYDWQGEYRVLEVNLPGGSRITALPANPDTARGFSGNVFLDEFAFHQSSAKIWRALFPVVSAGFDLRITSTPNGKNNKFYELMEGGSDRWSRHHVDIYEAIAAGLPRDAEELREALADDDGWAQEYELQWLDEATAWLSYEQIQSCEHHEAGGSANYMGHECYIGNDIARRNDLWVAWVLERIGDVLWTREVVCLRRASFAEQDAEMDRLMGTYRVVRVAADKTGIGEKPVEDMQRRYGEHRVEGVTFTGPTKLNLASIGKNAFERRRIRIPEKDKLIRQDLHSLKKTVTAIGNMRFDAEREGGSHADRAWACFLALYAAGDAASEISFETAGQSIGAAIDEPKAGRTVVSPYDFDFLGGQDFGGF